MRKKSETSWVKQAGRSKRGKVSGAKFIQYMVLFYDNGRCI
jgi:hypothetical protein